MEQLNLVKTGNCGIEGQDTKGELVECQICGLKSKQISTSHLVLKHGIQVKDYREMFPNSPISAPNIKAEMSKRKRRYWEEHPDAKIEHGKKMRKAWDDPERRTRFLESFHRRPPKTEEQRRNSSNRMKNLYKERLLTSEQKDKLFKMRKAESRKYRTNIGIFWGVYRKILLRVKKAKRDRMPFSFLFER